MTTAAAILYFIGALLWVTTDTAPSTNLFIVGGGNAAEYKWLHQASLQYRPSPAFYFSHVCGASLINEEWVLTAAHCVYQSVNPDNFQVVLGEYDTSLDSGDEQTVLVASIIVHPQFIGAATGFPYDIALVKLSEKAQITPAVAPLALSDDPLETFVDRECTTLGWGLTDSAANVLPNVLQEANITTITNEECSARWMLIEILESQICVYKLNMSPCNGDSGGSLVCRDSDGAWRLAGVTSWGISTCSGSYPAVNTRVSSYMDWINEVTAAN